MSLQFVEHWDNRDGWRLEVHRSGITIGNVRRNPISKDYGYFHGPINIITPCREDRDRASLKAWVESTYGR